MIKAAFFLILIIVGLIQTAILDYFCVFGVKPDLFLDCMVMAVLFFDFKWALFFSFLAGFLKDSVVASAFGLNTFLFSLWGYLAIRLSRKITLEKYFLASTLIFIIVVINDVVVRSILFYLTNLTVPAGIFLRITLIESAYTALIFFPLFRVVKYQLSIAEKYALKDAHKTY